MLHIHFEAQIHVGNRDAVAGAPAFHGRFVKDDEDVLGRNPQRFEVAYDGLVQLTLGASGMEAI